MFRRALVIGLIAAGCASGRDEPPASAPPVTVSRTHAPYTDADVVFMQGMIVHHGQALEMTALAPSRSASETLRVLAERIEQTQLNEIERMTRWLETRGETAPDPRAYREHAAAGQGGHGAHMPGMLTPDEMDALAAATGGAFDRRFLESMIRHHEGALTMVAELQAAGGGIEAEVYRFAADVDADQRAEIARMQNLLNDLP